MVAIQKLKVGLVAFLFLSLIGIPMVWADDSERPWKTLTLKGGYFFSSSDTKLRIDGAGTGTTIDLEDVLGLNNNVSTYKVGVEWRFFDRHRFNVSYFDLSREATTALSATITIEDVVYPINDVLVTEFDWKVMTATYTWSFLQTNTYEVGFTI